MLGRSDGTLNPNGVRFGSAEIYNIVEPYIEIEDRYIKIRVFLNMRVFFFLNSHSFYLVNSRKCIGENSNYIVLFLILNFSCFYCFCFKIFHIVLLYFSLCVGQRTPDGEERVILFLKMADTFDFNDSIVKSLRTNIRTNLSARHVPTMILPIEDIPYTVNGKKVEVAVKKVLAGQPVKNQGALRNPESLDLYMNIPEVQKF